MVFNTTCGIWESDIRRMFSAAHPGLLFRQISDNRKFNNMMTPLNGKIFRITSSLWGNPLVTSGFPSWRPVTRIFDVFFDLHLNKQLSKHSRCRWFEILLCSLWHHRNEMCTHFCYALFKVFRSVQGEYIMLNTLWPSDAIWQCRSGSTLAQIMAYCFMAPSHYLNQCWLNIKGVLWH